MKLLSAQEVRSGIVYHLPTLCSIIIFMVFFGGCLVRICCPHLQLCDVMVREVSEGVEGSGVRCGVIGEVGVSHPMTDFEKRSLQASAMAQQITGE